MSKELTCRMIDGNPVVEYKEEYFPKKGDIVKISVNDTTVLAVHDKYIHYQAMVTISIKEKNTNMKLRLYMSLIGEFHIIDKATPEECEVMHHILNENGYELKGDTVVKKRWIPKIYEEYYFIKRARKGLGIDISNRGHTDDSLYMDAFRTKEAAQSACDKLNELLLSLPQG